MGLLTEWKDHMGAPLHSLCKREEACWVEAANEAASVQQGASLCWAVDVPLPASSPAVTSQK